MKRYNPGLKHKKEINKYMAEIVPAMYENPDGEWMRWEHVNWISVKDRLPSKDASYIIHAPSLDKKSPFITCAWYDPNLPGWSMLPECWLKAITHWMPLPEAPKE